MTENLVKLLPKIKGQYRENVNLSKVTWFRVGGPAEVIFKPQDTEDLSYFLTNIDKEIPLNILGLCSNIIIRDKGIPGVTIRLGGKFTGIQVNDDTVTLG